MRRPHLLLQLACLVIGFAAAFGGQQQARGQVEAPEDGLTPEQIAQMSLEELLSLQVTSVQGTAQGWFSSPAAIYVITGEDIRRSGHRSIAEALRLAPGVFVGRVTSQAHSIGMRGFNGGLANKTLVLIDGRAVYDPLFGGTFWNVQDYMLEDIDRIEVIRGPGPTLWGANAVNGVINIITKSAQHTQGSLLLGGGGTYERAFGAARHGMKLGDDSWLRIYGKWFERDHLVDGEGDSAHDDWAMTRGGFRFDHEGDDDITLTLQGDIYHSDRIGEFVRQAPLPGAHLEFFSDIRDVRHSGGNALFRMAKDTADHGWSFQTYYDRTERETNVSFYVERDTFDVDWRHYFGADTNHSIMWGLGARHTRDQSRPGASTTLTPSGRSLDTFTAFIQDTITLKPDRWFLMIGSKFEHNDYTGFEFQPSARLWWTPSDRHTLWGAVSRPVRTPTRIEREGIITLSYVDTGLAAGGPPSGVFVPLSVIGSDVKSEELMAYEAGYRVRLTKEITLDAAIFYNDYDRLIYVPPTIVGLWNNDGEAETYGGELAATWEPTERCRFEASYSYVDVHLHGPILTQDEFNTPHHQVKLRSFVDLTDDLELNSALYFVDNVPTVQASSYWRLDVGVTWQVNANFELALWGQNLLDAQHREFSAFNEVERGFYLLGTLRF